MAERRGSGFKCLAIESAGAAYDVAACRDGQISRHSGSEAGAKSRHIYASVGAALDALDLRLTELQCIAFGRGPGGFTGLRIGAAVVQALAYGASIPVCSISSLASMALLSAEQHGADAVATCLDARMGEAYLAIYRPDKRDLVSATVQDCLVDPAHFTIDPSIEFFAAGPGWLEYPDFLERHRGVITGRDLAIEPSAPHLLLLAEKRYLAGKTCLPSEALPNYIRDKVTG